MQDTFPAMHAIGYAPRHESLWEWTDQLTPGVEPPARIEVWPRGGGKSSTVELICTRLATTLQRRFALYVCGTQDQADLHVQSISALMEQAGLTPAVSRLGRYKAWRRDQLRTSTGFSVAGYGLDVASRGIKIEQYRPDLIIFDDVDREDDSPVVVDNKILSLTQAILPTGTSDCAVVVIQNLVSGGGVVARLAQGRADFLLHRNPVCISPAVEGLEVTPDTADSEEKPRWIISRGIATWSGQDLQACAQQINRYGLDAFLREAQHEVSDRPANPVFDVEYLESLLLTLPPPIRVYKEGENGLCGTLEVWELPEPDVEYVIGADVSQGIKRATSDESTAEVLRVDTGAQVASYYGKPDDKNYAQDLQNLAYTYNEAECAPESNEFGRAVIAYLVQWGGTRIWYSGKSKAVVTPDQDNTGGFRTGEHSKALTDGELRSALVECKFGKPSIVIRSKRCIEQMCHYIYLESGGRGNEPGYKDDHVRSLGIAYYLVKLRREALAGLEGAAEADNEYRPRYVAEYAERRLGR